MAEANEAAHAATLEAYNANALRTALKIFRQCRNDVIARCAAATTPHASVLRDKETQLAYRDEYGKWQIEDWNQELDRFAVRFADFDRIASKLSQALLPCLSAGLIDQELAKRLNTLLKEDAREAICQAADISAVPPRTQLYSPYENAVIDHAGSIHLANLFEWDAYERPAAEARLVIKILKRRVRSDQKGRRSPPRASGPRVNTGRELESYCVNTLTSLGWDPRSTAGSGDQGADIVASAHGIRIVVQCKDHVGRVGNSAVQEVASAKAHYNASHAIVVASGGYTKSARQLANSNQVHLCSPSSLGQQVRQLA